MSQRSKADQAQRLDKARRIATRCMGLLDTEVQEFFDAHEQGLLKKTLDLAATGEPDKLRAAALELKCWREMRSFISGSVANLPRIDAALAAIADQTKDVM